MNGSRHSQAFLSFKMIALFVYLFHSQYPHILIHIRIMSNRIIINIDEDNALNRIWLFYK